MKKIFWSIIPLFLLIGCFDEGGPTSTQAEHFIAFGMKLSDEQGNDVYRVFKGLSQDTLRLKTDTTYHFSVRFFDRDSSDLAGPEGTHYPEGRVDSLNHTAAEGEPSSSDPIQVLSHDPEFLEQNELPFWTISLKTGDAGTAVFRFFAIHVDHSDFNSPQIFVHISDSNSQ